MKVENCLVNRIECNVKSTRNKRGKGKPQRDNLCNPIELRFAKLCTESWFVYHEQSFFIDLINITSMQRAHKTKESRLPRGMHDKYRNGRDKCNKNYVGF